MTKSATEAVRSIFKASKPDPRILIVQVIVVSILSFSLSSWTGVVLLFLAVDVLACLLLDARVAARFLVIYAVVFAIQRALSYVYVPVLSPVLAMFFVLYLKVIPVYITTLIVMRRSRMNELLAAMRKLHIPMLVLIPFSVMYRFLPTLRQESRYVRESLMMRGLNASFRQVAAHPIRSVEHYVVPLLFRSEQITEELSAATLCRGLDVDRERSCCADVALSGVDFLYASLLLIGSGMLMHIGAHVRLL